MFLEREILSSSTHMPRFVKVEISSASIQLHIVMVDTCCESGTFGVASFKSLASMLLYLIFVFLILLALSSTLESQFPANKIPDF